jgi:ABC-2 type transport system permease protein
VRRPPGRLRLAVHQYRYDQKMFWREPASVFFTVALPVIFLFLFASIFGNRDVKVGVHKISGVTYFVPSILTLAIVSATLLNLAITISIQRERGMLKRLRSTPLPQWAFFAGRILTCSVITLLLVLVMVVIGRVVYGVNVPGHTMPGLILTVIVGTASFCSLGFALTAAIPSENAAPAVTNAIVLPLYFFSGVFIPNDQLPAGMRFVGGLFAVKHLFQSLLTAFNPATTGAGIAWSHLGVLVLWGIAGALVAVRVFRWTPSQANAA